MGRVLESFTRPSGELVSGSVSVIRIIALVLSLVKIMNDQIALFEYYKSSLDMRSEIRLLCDVSYFNHLAANPLDDHHDVIEMFQAERVSLQTTRCVVAVLRAQSKAAGIPFKMDERVTGFLDCSCSSPETQFQSCIEEMLKNENIGPHMLASIDESFCRHMQHDAGVVVLTIDNGIKTVLQVTKSIRDNLIAMQGRRLAVAPDEVEAEHEANNQVKAALKLLKIAAPEEGGGIIDELDAAQRQHIDLEILEALDAEEDLLFDGGDEMEAALEGNDEVEAALEGIDLVEAEHEANDQVETALKLLKIAAPEEGGGIIDKLVAAQSQHIDPEILEALDAEEDLLFEGGDEMEAAHEGNDEVEAALEGNDEVEAAHGGSDEPEAKE